MKDEIHEKKTKDLSNERARLMNDLWNWEGQHAVAAAKYFIPANLHFAMRNYAGIR